MATLEQIKPKLDAALQYLKKCDDFSVLEAREALEDIAYGGSDGSDRQTKYNEVSYLVRQGYGKLFGRMWNGLSGYLEKDKWEQDGFKTLEIMVTSYFNFTDYYHELAAELGNYGYIPELFAGLGKLDKYFEDEENSQTIYEVLESILFLLDNSIFLCKSNRKIYRDANAVAIFSKYLKSQNGMVRVVSLTILAYVVNESESSVLATSDGGLAILLEWMKRAVNSSSHQASIGSIGASAMELLDCLNHLAMNDDNKIEIQKQDGIPTIVRMLEDDFDEKHQCVAAEAVWNLAFVESIRTSPELQEAVPFLDKLRKSKNKELRKTSGIAFWEINDNRPEDLPTQPSSPQELPPSYEESVHESQGGVANTAQVMISYQWDYQPIAKKIRDDLVRNGFKVWLDLTNLRDSILASMADAVEKSDIILMLMSEAYKDSQSCRTEAEYAYKKKKKVIPLLVQQDYDHPDGWLGAVLGAKLYYKFFTDDLSKTDMPQLLTALRESAPATGAPDEHDGPITPTTTTGFQASPSPESKPSASNWTEDDVQEWLKKIKLDDVCSAFDGHDGTHLEDMYQTLCSDPKELKREMISEDGGYTMNANMYRKFTVGLKKVFLK